MELSVSRLFPVSVFCRILALFLLLSLFTSVHADPTPQGGAANSTGASRTLTIAVANSFRPVAELIAAEFSQRHNVQIQLASASSGVLANQILHGAPFDLFLSADSARPALLVDRGLAYADSRLTYARGILVFWWPPGGSHKGGEPRLKQLNDVSRLSIANPRTAPYGEAAKALLQGQGLWTSMQKRLVRGAGASQAYQFVASGNIAAGLLPQSLLLQGGVEHDYLVIPQELYPPLAHQAVVIKNGKAQLARQFLQHLLGAGQNVLAEHGFYPAASFASTALHRGAD
ncbi:molybdate ABC transporter substrate-binding protein [Corallincola holothuriorum]|uniref:Molybdate ABC transporter substrate-binding protein n=1 Tax=Corallincola holothuriorum TaxID=2282215 RepID=A0A368NP81_9GAMM|nr:molybdate ABC transporter substrate-binding protein [Corallincola holothuriorum]RCU51693.1 molybdate ABC transporter substrate-binding protein [Corallincola holothuriorum]